MPGSVANAVIPTVSGHPLVFPFGLCRAFTETSAFAARVNEYHDRTTQRVALVTTSRKSWRLVQRLTPTLMATLRTFILTYPTAAFYFYDLKQPDVGQLEGANYDPTGAALPGRYTVRLNGDLNETIYISRTEISVELVEVA